MKVLRLIMVFILAVVFTASSEAAIIHGFVREKDSGEPIIMCNIWIVDTNIGTTSNMKGYYVISGLQPGQYKIRFTFIGYRLEEHQISVSENSEVELNILLETKAVETEGVEITAEEQERKSEIRVGQIALQNSQLRSIPQTVEPDLFRSLQMLPGVATLSDFSAGLYIRGGSPDQNMILLDQIDVYNPNHMFGFFSTFNTDAVKSVQLLKGGFPATYGGRLSSVLTVQNKEGNRQKLEGIARLSMISASATLEGPWENGSWMISGRRTFIDYAAKLIDENIPYYFYDGHAKFNFDLDKNNQASLSFYAGNDRLDLSQGGTDILLSWGNKTFSAQWMHLFSSKLFSQFMFAGSRFDSDSKVNFEDISFGIFNKITDLSIKGTLSYTPSLRHKINFGFEGKDLDFGLNYRVVGLSYPNSFSGQYASFFMDDVYHLTDLNILESGLRFSYYTDGTYSRLTPRVSYKRILTANSNFRLSYGRYVQFLNLVEQEGFSFASMWFPVDDTFKPGKADHYIIGYTYDNNRTFSIDLEAYYKKYYNIAEFRTFRGGDESLTNQTAAQNFLSGTGKAYGADIYIRNNFWGFTGWIGYSLCWTKKQVDGYNFNKEYYPTYDRRHTITAVQDFHLSSAWRINLAFKYGSGQPYTQPTARYTVLKPDGNTFPAALDGEKNFYRLPAYHRLDVGIFYKTRLFKLDTEVYLQVINVYKNKNVWFRRYQVYNNPATVEDFHMLPLLPTFGMTVRF